MFHSNFLHDGYSQNLFYRPLEISNLKHIKQRQCKQQQELWSAVSSAPDITQPQSTATQLQPQTATVQPSPHKVRPYRGTYTSKPSQGMVSKLDITSWDRGPYTYVSDSYGVVGVTDLLAATCLNTQRSFFR